MKHRMIIVCFGLLIMGALVGCAVPPPATTAPTCANFSGTWNTTEGPVTISQNGCSLEGIFPSPIRFHSLRGVVSGNRLTFDWEGPLGTGRGIITLDSTLNGFTGTWGYGPETKGGVISGARGAWPN